MYTVGFALSYGQCNYCHRPASNPFLCQDCELWRLSHETVYNKTHTLERFGLYSNLSGGILTWNWLPGIAYTDDSLMMHTPGSLVEFFLNFEALATHLKGKIIEKAAFLSMTSVSCSKLFNYLWWTSHWLLHTPGSQYQYSNISANVRTKLNHSVEAQIGQGEAIGRKISEG